VLRRTIIAILLLSLLTGCGASAANSKPVVDVISPPEGAHFQPGERINLRIAAASSNQVARIEVHANGTLVAAQDNPTPASTFSAVLAYSPAQTGSLHLVITALDGTGQRSDALTLNLEVGATNLLETAATATPSVTGAPPDPSCKLSATFVTDVTIPDNTAVNAGAGFVKTWRLRNTSQCGWENGYVLAFSEGEQMGGPPSVPVPPTARDAAIDVSVPFTAPTTSGLYTSTWRLRSPDGQPFGNRVFVVIRVP
jgi:hypothetical protein